MQAAVPPFYEDLVKFAKLGFGVQACPVKGYRVQFDSQISEILVEGSKNWIPLKDIADLPYSVPSGFSYRRFVKFRAEQITAGHPDPLIGNVQAPPVLSPDVVPPGGAWAFPINGSGCPAVICSALKLTNLQ